MRTMLVFMTILASCGGRRDFGKVDGGDVTLEGKVDADYFVRQLDQLDPWFEACYARTLRRSRNTEGVIVLRMHGKHRRLEPIVVQNKTESAELADCVKNAVSNLSTVEPNGAEPWDFTAEWAVTFSIIRRN